MERPFVIKDVENIVLRASAKHGDTHPLLVAQFPCRNVFEEDNCISLQLMVIFNFTVDYGDICRSVLSAINATQVTINGISINVETSGVSAVTLRQCSQVHIMSINLTSNDEQCDNLLTGEGTTITNVGVLAYECNNVEVELLQANNFSDGVILYSTSNTNITEMTLANNSRSGAVIHSTSNTIVTSSHVIHNAEVGIAFLKTCYTDISCVYSINNGGFGLDLYSTEYTSISTCVFGNNSGGIYLTYCRNTTMINITSAHNQWKRECIGACDVAHGVSLLACSNTTMITLHQLMISIMEYTFRAAATQQ